MKNIFTDHPESIGETYWQHFFFASLFGIKMVAAGLACLVHAIFPMFFVKTGSNILISLINHFVERMPRIESRIKKIGDTINKKIAEQQ